MSAKRVEELHALLKEIEIAMLTTRRADGHLVSRPMALQKAAPGADLWFVTASDAGMVPELRADPHVNLAFYKDRTREYVSVTGTAVLSQDRALIGRLYAPDWKVWFEDQGGAYDGSPDDPRLLLIGVTVESARFLTVTKPQAVVFVEYLKGRITGKAPDLGQVQQVSGTELRSRPPPS